MAQFGIWVRLHYVYPYPSVDDVIPLMAEGKILPYLDVPFQHASQEDPEGHEAPGLGREQPGAHPPVALDLPEIVIRSTFITGFPGETERISTS